MRTKAGRDNYWDYDEEQPWDGRGRPPRGGRHSYWGDLGRVAKGLYVSTALVTAIVVGAGLFVYLKARQLETAIHSTHVAGLSNRPIYGQQNILVLGSQTRDGQGKGFGVDPNTNLSDNMLLVHLDPTHTHATIMSIPRDLVTYQPACPARSGLGVTTWPAQTAAQIDGVMNHCGPSGAVRVVKMLTGIRIDHFVEFDFNSFRRMVDAFGGVEVCVPKGGYHDSYSNLNLAPGLHLLTYDKALAYVRTRHGVGNGGDLGRIELQQAFISSVIQKVNQKGLLANTGKLYHIASIAIGALTVDQGLGTVSSLLNLANSLRGLHAANVNLVTVPTNIYTQEQNWLQIQQPEDDLIFQTIRADQTWTGNPPTAPPAKVQVKVLNATGIPNLAGKTRHELRRWGFDVVGTGDAAPTSATTVSYNGLASAEDAYTVVNAMTGNPGNSYYPDGIDSLTGHATEEGAPGVVTLTLGSDFLGINRPPAPPKKHHRRRRTSVGAAATVNSRNAGANICSGLPPPNPNG